MRPDVRWCTNVWEVEPVTHWFLPLLKETPQYKAFVVWDKARQIYAEPALPLWDEIESRMADRLVTAYADKSLLDNPAGNYFNVHTTINTGGAIRGQLVKAN